MMTPEEYLDRVRAVVSQAAQYVRIDPQDRIYELIEHGEPAEGLCYLAWTIVNEKVLVPRVIIEGIRGYSAGLVDEEHMPADLDDYIQNVPPAT